MKLVYLDGLIIAAYFIFVLLVGISFTKKGGKNVGEYFVSGRNLHWWLAGTSMVATTFAADTPLAVTGLVASHGIAGNWLWWNMVFSGILTVFVFARLWRRSEVITDVEFVEARYSGTPASILRGFKAVYLAIPINCIIIGWVNLAMVKILQHTIGIPPIQGLALSLGITLVYSALGGLWSIVITDFIQFWLAMVGAVLLMFFALEKVGGIAGLQTALAATYPNGKNLLNFFPDIDSPWMPLSALVTYLAVTWWASWYPGAEPGGGGYIAQRIFSAKNERHSLLAALWFNIAHYTIRPWPWILVALVAMVLYPNLTDKETGYILAMNDLLPAGLRGLMLAGFFAAYMSTLSTHLNWGASYLINDVYKRFINPNASENHYVLLSRITTIVIAGISVITTLLMNTISGAWKFLIAIGAGTGSVYILRWFWWRINAWSEISAMLAAFIISVSLQFGLGWKVDVPYQFVLMTLTTVIGTTFVWGVVTLLTAPVAQDKLIEFYRRVKPPGWWKPVKQAIPNIQSPDNLPLNLINWLSGCALIYCVLFGLGKLIFGDILFGLTLIIIALFLWLNISRNLKTQFGNE
ncbi:MAG: Na+:solute symporter [bacterium]|nr:Na+:solute symporter [bacterium]